MPFDESGTASLLHTLLHTLPPTQQTEPRVAPAVPSTNLHASKALPFPPTISCTAGGATRLQPLCKRAPMFSPRDPPAGQKGGAVNVHQLPAAVRQRVALPPQGPEQLSAHLHRWRDAPGALALLGLHLRQSGQVGVQGAACGWGGRNWAAGKRGTLQAAPAFAAAAGSAIAAVGSFQWLAGPDSFAALGASGEAPAGISQSRCCSSTRLPSGEPHPLAA